MDQRTPENVANLDPVGARLPLAKVMAVAVAKDGAISVPGKTSLPSR
jgi:hypothetical protein